MNKYVMLFLASLILVIVAGCSDYQTPSENGAAGSSAGKSTSGASVSKGKERSYTPPAGRRMLAEDFSSSLRTGTTIVYFAKVSCPACEAQNKIWQRVVKKLPQGVKAEKRFTYAVNYRAYGVTQLPTLIFYKDGVEKSRMIGVSSENKIISAAKSAL